MNTNEAIECVNRVIKDHDLKMPAVTHEIFLLSTLSNLGLWFWAFDIQTQDVLALKEFTRGYLLQQQAVV